MVRKAVCCCGQCAIEVTGEPYVNGVCHCDDCKRRTGAAFGWNVYFANADVSATVGEVRHYRLEGRNPQTRFFCATCGSTLYWKSAFLPNHTGVAGGCFAESAPPEPTVTVSNPGREAWVGLPDAWATELKL